MSYLAKLSQSPRLMTLAACGAMLATIFVDPAFAGPNNASTYQFSCRNIGVSGATLTASCSKINGRYINTAIQIRGIVNVDGDLTYSRNLSDSSSYQNSCRNISVSNKTTLTATCLKRDGGIHRTLIGILGIENRDGILRYSK